MAVVIAIGLVLTAISIPYVAGMLRASSLSTQAQEFMSTLNYARSEAIKRNQRVTICKSADGLECTTDDGWEQGWIVFVDVENSATVADPDDILRVNGPMGSELTLTGNTPVSNYVSYVGRGEPQRLTGAFLAGTLTLCRQDRGVKMVIARTGRVRTENTTCN